MCVMIAKYLENEGGWVGVKNRDRNYKPTIKIKQSFKEDIESIYIYDSITKFSEGMNEYGICILNTATQVKNDESESSQARHQLKKKKKKLGVYYSFDGVIIRKALKTKKIEEAIKILIENELKGNFLVFNKDVCYILEGGSDEESYRAEMEKTKEDSEYEWEKLPYVYVKKEISKNKIAIRTNHGIFLDWMGYDPDSDNEHTVLSRKSSDNRYDVALKNVKEATTPEGMLRAISDISNKNPQMNPLRVDNINSNKTLKTTAQIMLNPNDNRLTFRPIWGVTSAENFGKINNHKSKLYLNFLSYKLNETTSFKEFYNSMI